MKLIREFIIIAVLAASLAACASPDEQPTPTALPTEILTSVPATPTNPIVWSGLLVARKPKPHEIYRNSIWVTNLIELKDMHYPDSESHTGQVKAGEEYLFPVYWCATDIETLHDNLKHISTLLVLNGEVVPDEYIYTYDLDSLNSGWKCNYRSVILSGWKQNTDYVLEVRRALDMQVFDGQSNYAPGNYTYTLTVRIP
jgi:hypothetical protein